MVHRVAGAESPGSSAAQSQIYIGVLFKSRFRGVGIWLDGGYYDALLGHENTDTPRVGAVIVS